MAKCHFIAPADIEPTVLCTVNGKMDWQLLPVEAQRTIEDGDDKKKKETYSPRVEFLNSLEPGDTIFAPLGGCGDAFLVGAFQRGAHVQRITYHEAVKFPEASIPLPKFGKDESVKLRERYAFVAKMIELVQTGHLDSFRGFREIDLSISMIRVLINQLISVQDEIRKRLQQRTTRLQRDSAYIIEPESPTKEALKLKKSLLSRESDPVNALLDYEDELTRRIEGHLKILDVWKKILEPVRGIGPRLAARIIAPIVDIRRFPNLAGFVKYAGWSTIKANDGHSIAARFTRGESAQFHELLRQGIWLFGGQIVRNNSQFRRYYDQYKDERETQIGQAVHTDKIGKEQKMTKIWLHKRALRYACSKFIKYLWFGWWELEGKTFTSKQTGEPFSANDLLG